MVVIIALSLLRSGWDRYPDAEHPLRAWHQVATEADWARPTDAVATFGTASVLKKGRMVFNIKGNDYRLIVYVRYRTRTVYLKWFGTHAQYDRVDAQTVEKT